MESLAFKTPHRQTDVYTPLSSTTSMGASMKKSFPTSCNRHTSTSTLPHHHPAPKPDNNPDHDNNLNPPRKSVTLEEMILQLELEEERARRATLLNNNDNNKAHRRMSCVNNSDILRSARNALNQYPRFSLDGKDAMYKSTFNNNNSRNATEFLTDQRRMGVREPLQRRRASSMGGETVVWCNPGVVARLMGLDAVPVPVRKMKSTHRNTRIDVKEEGVRRWNHPRRKAEMVGGNGVACSSSRTGYCVMRPVSSRGISRECNGWENTRPFL